MSLRDKKKDLVTRDEPRAQKATDAKTDPEWDGKCRESLAAAKAILNSPYLKSRAHSDFVGSRRSQTAIIPPKALHGLLSPSPPRDGKDISFGVDSSLFTGAQKDDSGDDGRPFQTEDQLMLSIEQLIASHNRHGTMDPKAVKSQASSSVACSSSCGTRVFSTLTTDPAIRSPSAQKISPRPSPSCAHRPDLLKTPLPLFLWMPLPPRKSRHSRRVCARCASSTGGKSRRSGARSSSWSWSARRSRGC